MMNKFGSYIEYRKDQNVVFKHVNGKDPMKGDMLCKIVKSKYVLPLKNMFKDKETKETIFTFELAKGGDLLNYIIRLGRPLYESECRIVLKRVLKGISVLHDLRICHRDIKHQNILLMEEGNLNSCVVADLGLACQIPDKGYMDQYCGTEQFMAPEIKDYQEYNQKVDLWSLGVLVFFSLTKKFPSADVKGDIERLKISDYLRDLLFDLFEDNPNSRLSASAALDHHFFGKTSKKGDKEIIVNNIIINAQEDNENSLFF